MKAFLEYLIVFVFCASSGWLLEVVYRSIVEKRFVNPGFLLGPWLPIYGFGGLFVYELCKLCLEQKTGFLGAVSFFIVSCIVMTVLEGVAGIVLLHRFKTRLWDYSDCAGNFKGVICPLFSVIWGTVCTVFRYLLFPFLSSFAMKASSSAVVPFLAGMWFGIFTVDLWHSFDLVNKLRMYAEEKKMVINIDRLKAEIYEQAKRMRTRPRFSLFKGRHMLKRHIEDFLNERFKR